MEFPGPCCSSKQGLSGWKGGWAAAKGALRSEATAAPPVSSSADESAWDHELRGLVTHRADKEAAVETAHKDSTHQRSLLWPGRQRTHHMNLFMFVAMCRSNATCGPLKRAKGRPLAAVVVSSLVKPGMGDQ